MTLEDISKRCHTMWNARGRLPLHLWLQQSQTRDETERLEMLGNIVMPQCGRLALHAFASFLRPR